MDALDEILKDANRVANLGDIVTIRVLVSIARSLESIAESLKEKEVK